MRRTAPALEATALRRLREALFWDARNIARPEVIAAVLARAGAEDLAGPAHAGRADDPGARAGFELDRQRAVALGAHGFPTLVLRCADRELRFGAVVSYDRLEQAVSALSGADRRDHPIGLDEAVAAIGRGSTLEYATLLGRPRNEVGTLLTARRLRRTDLPGGAVWQP